VKRKSQTGPSLASRRWAVVFSACTFCRESTPQHLRSLQNAVSKYLETVKASEEGRTIT
jgi:hypothetical protein